MEQENKEKKSNVKTAFKVICIIGLIVGIMLWLSAKTTETYDLKDFRSQRDARYVDKTEDLLSENETCEINGNEIKVTTLHNGLYYAGMSITIVFGLIDGVWLLIFLDDKLNLF